MPKSDFPKDRSKHDGLDSRCKPCSRARYAKYNASEAGLERMRRHDEKRVGTAKRRASNNRAVAKLRAADPNYARRVHLKHHYGLTLEEFDQTVDDHQGVCAICQNECITGGNLSVDHCHETGEVRGFLCRTCNLGLGDFKDSVKIIQNAVAYLQRKDGPHRIHRSPT